MKNTLLFIFRAHVRIDTYTNRQYDANWRSVEKKSNSEFKIEKKYTSLYLLVRNFARSNYQQQSVMAMFTEGKPRHGEGVAAPARKWKNSRNRKIS